MHPYVISVFGNINCGLHKYTFPNLHSSATYKHCTLSDSVDVQYSFCNRVSVLLNFILFLNQCKVFLHIFYDFLCFSMIMVGCWCHFFSSWLYLHTIKIGISTILSGYCCHLKRISPEIVVVVNYSRYTIHLQKNLENNSEEISKVRKL